MPNERLLECDSTTISSSCRQKTPQRPIIGYPLPPTPPPHPFPSFFVTRVNLYDTPSCDSTCNNGDTVSNSCPHNTSDTAPLSPLRGQHGLKYLPALSVISSSLLSGVKPLLEGIEDWCVAYAASALKSSNLDKPSMACFLFF